MLNLKTDSNGVIYCQQLMVNPKATFKRCKFNPSLAIDGKSQSRIKRRNLGNSKP